MIGAVEAGGTKFRVAVFDDGLVITDEARIDTTAPDATLSAVADFFRGRPETIDALGVACFGPVDLDPSSDSFGSILATPKPGWSGAPVLGTLRDALDVPAGIDSDVGAAAMAEAAFGTGVGQTTVSYVTVGTGIGGAVYADGRVHRGHGHSEFGHIPIDRAAGDEFPGACPYHGDCLEGMASGAAIARRKDVGDEDPYRHIPDYLAQLVQTLTYTFAPDVISFGGGVFHREGLIDQVRAAAIDRISGYTTTARPVSMDDYVARSPLDQDAGLLGAGLIATTLIAAEGGERTERPPFTRGTDDGSPSGEPESGGSQPTTRDVTRSGEAVQP